MLLFLQIFIVLLSLSIVIDTLRLGISPMPSSRKAKKILLSLAENSVINKSPKHQLHIYELGSGWGNLALALGKKHSVRAFERAFVPWIFSCLQKSLRRNKRVSIEKKDFLQEDLSKADVLICYLYPGAMKKLAPKFENELKKGALVLSNSFQIPGKKPDQIIDAGDWMQSTIYCYHFS